MSGWLIYRLTNFA